MVGHTGVSASLVAIAIALSACGLAAWRQPARALLWISASSVLAMVAAATLAGGGVVTAAVYGGGVVLACALGYAGFTAAGLVDGTTARFAGRWESRPTAALVAFIGALGLAGAPLWPTFWGEDLVIHTALGANRALAVAVAVILAANGYLGMRNFAYAFMGRASALRAS
jgi:NADH:ubiquinone oxidoreductase subunit 2 (subunit N)